MTDPIIIPRDFGMLERWFDIIRHANRIVIHGSQQWVHIGVFLDADGKPQFWEVNEPSYIYPKSKKIEIKD